MRRADAVVVVVGLTLGAGVFAVIDGATGTGAGAAMAAARPRSVTPVTPGVARRVFASDCAVCHGPAGEGTDRGPSLVGAGAASADYELTTGRMPLASPTESTRRHPPRYPPAMIDALVGIVAGFGPGPTIPAPAAAGADVADGGTLFRLNCAGCHQSVGQGGALIDREAPALTSSTAVQVAEAVRLGPGQMPAFGRAALDDRQLADVAAFVQTLHHPDDRGGLSLWHLGPVPEGAVALVAGLGLAVLVTMWIGDREPRERP